MLTHHRALPRLRARTAVGRPALPVPLPKIAALVCGTGARHCKERPLADDFGLKPCAFQIITIKAPYGRRLGPLPLIGGLDARLTLFQLPSRHAFGTSPAGCRLKPPPLGWPLLASLAGKYKRQVARHAARVLISSRVAPVNVSSATILSHRNRKSLPNYFSRFAPKKIRGPALFSFYFVFCICPRGRSEPWASPPKDKDRRVGAAFALGGKLCLWLPPTLRLRFGGSAGRLTPASRFPYGLPSGLRGRQACALCLPRPVQ